MNILRRIAAVVRDPALGLEYAQWRLSPVRTIHGARVGGFVNFSEFHSAARHIWDNELRFWRGYPFGEGDILDVGANLGVVSLVLAQRFPDRRIFSFEPHPTVFPALCDNLKRNDAGNVKPLQLAISNQDGTAFFNASADRANAHIAASGTPVPCRRLDALCRELQIRKIAVLKIDIEGHELAALSAAPLEIISTIHFELVPDICTARGADPLGVPRLLAGAGFDLYRVDERGQLEEAGDRVGKQVDNLVAIRKT
jgi:FkbM family methyltransferase